MRRSKERLKQLSRKKEKLNSEVNQMEDEYTKARCINLSEWTQQTEIIRKKKKQLEVIEEKYMHQKLFYARAMLEYTTLSEFLEK